MFFNHFKVYNNVVRFISIKSVSKLSYTLLIPYLLACTVLYFIDISLSKIFFTSYFFSLGLIFSSRIIARALLNDIRTTNNVAILLDQVYLNDSDCGPILNIIENENYKVVSILSNEKEIDGLIINGVVVNYVDNIKKLIEKENVTTLFIPSKLNDKEIRKKFTTSFWTIL